MSKLPPNKFTGKSILSRFSDLKPEETRPIFKFQAPGHAIAAKFLSRRPVMTKMGNARALDIEIIGEIIGNSHGDKLGEFTIFESTHITQIFDQHNVQRGALFYLRWDSTDTKSNFKRYVFALVNGDDAPPADDIPY